MNLFLLFNIFPMVMQLQAGCPASIKDKTNWVHNEKLGKCYGQLLGQKFSFGQAERWCREQNAHLAMPLNAQDLMQVKKATFEKNAGIFWLGYDDIEFQSFYKYANGLVADNLPWEPNMPEKEFGKFCTTFNTNKIPLKIRNENCFNLFELICERPDWVSDTKPHQKRCPHGWVYFDCGGYCYKAPDKMYGMADAKDACAAMHSQLAMPKTRREYRSTLLTMKRLNDPTPDFDEMATWIGLEDHGGVWGLRWADGEVISRQDIYWTEEEFDRRRKRSPSKFCVALTLRGYFNYYSCSDEKYIVCKKPQTAQADTVCGKTQRTLETNEDDLLKESVNKNRRRTKRSKHRKLNLGFIWNGANMTIDEAPWAVSIIYQNRRLCGGALVSPRHVVTAAHCVYAWYFLEPYLKQDLKVGLGSHHIDERGGVLEDLHAVNIIESYAERSENDLAVVELVRELHVDCWNIRPLCLPEKKYTTWRELRCVHIGLGAGSGDTLKYCNLGKTETIIKTKNLIVTFYTHCRIDKGDSGSPLFCINEKFPDAGWFLMGVTSAMTDTENLFVRVDNFFMWINSIVQANVPPEQKMYSETICWNEHLDISCEGGRPPAIKVVSATWGRSTFFMCPQSKRYWLIWKLIPPWELWTIDTKCFSDVTEVVARSCNNKNGCQLHAVESILGEPCEGTVKYLTVTYKCVQPDKVYNQFRSLQCYKKLPFYIKCGRHNPLRIEVDYAIFGVQSTDICTNFNIPSDNKGSCHIDDFTEDAAKSCNNLNYCMKGWPTELNKKQNASCQIEEKGVAIYYSCLPEYDKRFLLCASHGQLNISCSEFDQRRVQVTTATYGHGTRHKCSGLSGQSSCSEDITGRIAASCNGKARCQTYLSESFFDRDPCPGSRNFFEVFYTCSEDKVSIICYPGGRLDMDCNAKTPHQISVRSANYGPSHQDVCATDREASSCVGRDVTADLAAKCNGKHACTDAITLPPSPAWGDPCPGYTKLLRVYYVCVPDFLGYACYDGDYDSTIELTCKSQTTIKVTRATFGRGGRGPCYVEGDAPSSCRGLDVTGDMQKKFDGKHYCLEAIDYKEWGDPCPVFPKYLEIYYNCV